jgi:hypothetical protein
VSTKHTKFKLRLDGVLYEIDTEKITEIKSTKINESILEQARDFSYWGSVYAAAENKVDSFKDDLGVLYAHLDVEIRSKQYTRHKYDVNGDTTDELEVDTSAKDFKVTEKTIENIIKTDHEYMQLHDKYLKMKLRAAQLKNLVEGLKMKKDMLQTFSSNMREEKGYVSERGKAVRDMVSRRGDEDLLEE